MFQAFESLDIHRSQIKNAPYNPRKIGEHERNKLAANIEKVGLVGPITWNKRTGHIVGGHQRLAALDALEGTQDYTLTVAVVDLDDRTEREQNVFLNNPSTQGEWDLELLEQMLVDESIEVSADAMGFDFTELQLLFDNPKIATMFSDDQEPAAEDIEKIQEMKEKHKSGIDKNVDNEHDPEFFLVLVFQTRSQSEEFCKRLNLPTDMRYVDGVKLLSELGAPMPSPDAHA